MYKRQVEGPGGKALTGLCWVLLGGKCTVSVAETACGDAVDDTVGRIVRAGGRGAFYEPLCYPEDRKQKCCAAAAARAAMLEEHHHLAEQCEALCVIGTATPRAANFPLRHLVAKFEELDGDIYWIDPSRLASGDGTAPQRRGDPGPAVALHDAAQHLDPEAPQRPGPAVALRDAAPEAPDA